MWEQDHSPASVAKTPRARGRAMYSGVAHEHGIALPSTIRAPSPAVRGTANVPPIVSGCRFQGSSIGWRGY